MPRDLSGRICLVTGASSGVGHATVSALAANGAEVYAAARRPTALDKLAATSPAIHPLPLDVADRAAVECAARSLATHVDRLDVLVLAAGVNIPRRRLSELSFENWVRLMDTNATGAFSMIQTMLPLLRAARGLVIVIGSVGSRWPDATSGVAYQASKRAALGIAHAIALEERDLRVSAILPGLIDTPLLDDRPAPPSPEERAQALKPEDIADVCLFLTQLHPRVFIPEIVVLPAALQRIGST